MNRLNRRRQAALARRKDAGSPIFVNCGEHGKKRWNGEVCCEKCERVFTTHDPTLPTHAPETCPCGVRLMPDQSKPKGGEYSARVACSDCFVKRVQADRGEA